ncbi:MAG: hypothetical protein JWM99_636 [Verrucomicrobiales bacterium]|nr:hypothetical protein [Verrucomicrobiales bacterium]
MSEASIPPAKQSRERKSGIVVPQKLKWHGELAALVAAACGKVLNKTLRIRFVDEAGLLSGNHKGPVIFATWHNRLALSMAAWREFQARLQPDSRLAALVSASRDGALLARILERNGVHPVRGSSSRRGAQALLELSSVLQKGYHVAITPDGPRGPRYVVQDGIIALAQLTETPIVAVSNYSSHKFQAKSWDRFQVPIPLSHCVISFAPMLKVPRDASDSMKQELKAELQRSLMSMTRD